MNGRDDESQLILAAAQRWISVTANTRDFASLLRAWITESRKHAGIIPQQRYSTGEIVRRMIRLTFSKVDLADGLYYLSNFWISLGSAMAPQDSCTNYAVRLLSPLPSAIAAWAAARRAIGTRYGEQET